MKCPACGHAEDRVVDSRATREGEAIRRRRECLNCEHRFTTYEYIETAPLMVIKKDGSRDPFDRQKLLLGVEKACWKRPIPREAIDDLVDSVKDELEREYPAEVPSSVIGERVMERLAQLDEAAYVRFASVYRHFKDINQFMQELKGALERAGNSAREKTSAGGSGPEGAGGS